jgi:glycosyltransferase involved in cell wall biosynthesis
MQKTLFPIEIIIGEDYSTDNTRAICEQFADQNPKLIKLITADHNVGAVANERQVLLQAQGKYIAYCEGDDYWTDPMKLQKQVDFLETHTDYSVCFHRFQHHDVDEDCFSFDNCDYLFKDLDTEGVDISIEMFFNNWITQPLTMVYRQSAYNIDAALQYKYYRDMHQIYHLLKSGKGYLFAFNGGVREIHRGGMHSMTLMTFQCDKAFKIAKELFENNRTIEVQKYYEDTIQWCIYEYCGGSKNKYKALIMSFKLFFIQNNLRKFGVNIKRLFR